MPRTLIEMREAATEPGLIQRASSGDRDAFDLLVRAHFAHVYAFLHRMIRSHEDAEDLAQETFVRAWRALPHYRGESSFTAWLLRIALHLARDHHRAAVRRPRFVEAEELRSSGGAPTETLSREELTREVARALERLPARLRAAVVLRTIEGREYAEVAAIIGVKPATARTHVMQARRMLLRWLRPWIDPRRDPDGGEGRR